MKNKVALLLFFTLSIMSILPLTAAFVIIGDTIDSQQAIYKSPILQEHLERSQNDQKLLSKLDSENTGVYKEQFEAIQDMKLIYGEDDYFSKKIKSSISKYFLFGLGFVTFFATLLGVLLSTIINKIYRKAENDLLKETARANYLSEVAKWQEIARRLAHEIRRPLQPIRTWMASLRLAYKNSKNEDFGSLLDEATEAIEEDIRALKIMVGEFSQFADLPKTKLEQTKLDEYLVKLCQNIKCNWNSAQIFLDKCETINVSLDKRLFKQILTNLIENAVEANPEKTIEVRIEALSSESGATIEIYNSGTSIPDEIRNRIFDPYFSTKSGKSNMGLGLAIVKSIVLEHQGTIECIKEESGARFRIFLPKGVNSDDQ